MAVADVSTSSMSRGCAAAAAAEGDKGLDDAAREAVSGEMSKSAIRECSPATTRVRESAVRQHDRMN